jgi:CheY-like chemotaxis protein
MAGPQILVVEDNEKNMKLLRDVLQAAGYRTLEATTGSRADERTASIPVLALTAQAMQGDRERFLAAGFDGYLSKPVNIAHLVATVEEHHRG